MFQKLFCNEQCSFSDSGTVLSPTEPKTESECTKPQPGPTEHTQVRTGRAPSAQAAHPARPCCRAPQPRAPMAPRAWACCSSPAARACAQRSPVACTPCARPTCAVPPSARSPSRLSSCCAPRTPTCAPQRLPAPACAPSMPNSVPSVASPL